MSPAIWEKTDSKAADEDGPPPRVIANDIFLDHDLDEILERHLPMTRIEPVAR